MRLLILGLLLLPNLALAQTPVDKDMANQYYQNCMGQESGMITKSAQTLMCACTSAHMMKNLSVEDVQTMSGQDQAARDALNKMIIKVYAPCIEAPAKDYYQITCIQNPDTKKLTNNPRKLCSCMAGEVAGYLQDNSVQVFKEILTRNPNIVDPMQALTSDPEFERFAQDKLIGCYSESR